MDLQIDGQGYVFVLMRDGTVIRSYGGEMQPFQYDGFPQEQNIVAATSLHLDDAVTSQSLYVVSQSQRTIFVTSKGGVFRAAYRPYDEQLFDLLADVTVVTDQNRQEIMYAVSGNTIFALPKGE